MQDFCPLCLKNGAKKKIKLFQLNLHEAVWTCEEEKCLWPFGYEDLIFIPRSVGKIWSCYWDNCKPMTHRTKETILPTKDPTSNSPANESQTDMLQEHVNNFSLASNSLESIALVDPTFTVAEKQDIPEQCSINKVISIHHDNTNLSTKNIIPDSTKSINNKEEHFQEHNFFGQVKSTGKNTKNVNIERLGPTITNIEKTNIDISNVRMGNRNSVAQYSDKKVLHFNNRKNDVLIKFTPASNNKSCSKFEVLNSNKHDKRLEERNSTKSNLNVTTTNIDGFSPKTVNYETVTPSDESNNYTTTNSLDKAIKLHGLRFKKPLNAKRGVTGGKQYEKFSFRDIKKKLEVHNNSGINDNVINSINQKPVLKNKDALVTTVKQENSNSNSCRNNCDQTVTNSDNSYHKTSVPPVTSNCPSSQVNNISIKSNSVKNQVDVTPLDAAIENTNVNIDTVLEDFLTTNCGISEDINDEWISSLLS